MFDDAEDEMLAQSVLTRIHIAALIESSKPKEERTNGGLFVVATGNELVALGRRGYSIQELAFGASSVVNPHRDGNQHGD